MIVGVVEGDRQHKFLDEKRTLGFREPTLGRHFISKWNGRLPDILKGIKNDISEFKS